MQTVLNRNQARILRHRTGLWALVGIVGAACGVAQGGSAPLASGVDLPVARAPRAEVAETLRSVLASDRRSRLFLILERAPSAAEVEKLLEAGVALEQAVSDRLFVARLAKDRQDVEAILAAAPISAALDIEIQHKLDRRLLEGEPPEWAIVPAGGKSAKDRGAAALEERQLAVYVAFHRGVPQGEAVETAKRHGAAVMGRIRSLDALVLELPESALRRLASEDSVMWVEPASPPLGECNDGVRARVRADAAHATPPFGLSGDGVRVLVYDVGMVSASHPDLANRVLIGDETLVAAHATHVAGTVAGDGALSSGLYAGVAPGADVVSFGIEVSGAGLPFYHNPADIEADYDEGASHFGAAITTNSLALNVVRNNLPCLLLGDYTFTSRLLDAIVVGSLGRPLPVVWAAGNERIVSVSNGQYICGEYGSISPPAAAKNAIVVGAVNSNDDSMTSFSSWGPTDDGRIKPDVVAPGCQLGGDTGVTSTWPDGWYDTQCGTSMATPATAGACALLIEQHRVLRSGEPDPTGAALKALLIHGAEDIGSVGPDYQSGYGSIRADRSALLLLDDALMSGDVGAGEVVEFTMDVPVSSDDVQNVRITIAWDDEAGPPLSGGASLRNDLDLVVIDPRGGRRWPWTLSPSNPSAPAVRTGPDRLNNVEQVSAPLIPGRWIVRVQAASIPTPGARQSFSLVATPRLHHCSDRGVARLDRAAYMCTATAGLCVADCGANSNPTQADVLAVMVTSDSQPLGVHVNLTETGPSTGEFRGQVALSDTPGSGVLLVAPGDFITLAYNDPDAGGQGPSLATDTAPIDCAPAAVLGMDVQPSARSARVELILTEPAGVRLEAALSCPDLPSSPVATTSAAVPATVQTLVLYGLEPGATYFLRAVVTDQAGNSTIHDNAGACFSFTTPDVPNSFTDLFYGGDARLASLVGRSLTLSPADTEDGYLACWADAKGFPTDPAGGAMLSGFASAERTPPIELPPGRFFPFAGRQLSRLYVDLQSGVTTAKAASVRNSFLRPEHTPFDASPAVHFAVPRVSGLLFDMFIDSLGSVIYSAESDRVALTFSGLRAASDVPGDFGADYQIELFFDGRIRLTWLRLDLPPGRPAIIGLSQGGGTPPGFALFEHDLLSANAPGAPPTVPGKVLITTSGGSVDIPLEGADIKPGPSPLIHRIESLPTHGTLYDVAFGSPITSAPHLAAASSLRYAPDPGYQGTDRFTYVADDGGTPPYGGRSGVATVLLEIGARQDIAEFLVDDSDPKWTIEGAWSFGDPGGGGSHAGDPVTAFTGVNVYGYNRSGDYENGIGFAPADSVGLAEGFENGVPGPGWKVAAEFIGLSNLIWAENRAFLDPFGPGPFPPRFPNHTGGAGECAASLADLILIADQADLLSPVFRAPDNAVLRFRTKWFGNAGSPTFPRQQTGTVDVSTDGGATWTTLRTFTEQDGERPGELVEIDLSQYAGQSLVLRFAYSVSQDSLSYWQVDDVYVVDAHLAPRGESGAMPAPHFLTSSPIDCSQASGVELVFRRWLGVERAAFDHANIQVSEDGQTWATVWEHQFPPEDSVFLPDFDLDDGQWVEQRLDIAEFADGRPNVQVRWGMGPTDASITYSGWSIDDVVIRGFIPTGRALHGDVDGDGVVDAADLGAMLRRWGAAGGDGGAADIDHDGVVDGKDLQRLLSSLRE